MKNIAHFIKPRKPVFKRVNLPLPHCPVCKDRLCGYGSDALPYICSCGEWEFRKNPVGSGGDYYIKIAKQMKKPIEKLNIHRKQGLSKGQVITLMAEKIDEFVDYLFPEEGGENPYPDSEEKIRNKRIMNDFLGDRADSSKIIFSPEPSVEWEERFEHLPEVLAIKSYGKSEKIIKNIEAFIRSEKEASYQQGREEVKGELRKKLGTHQVFTSEYLLKLLS